MWLCLTLQWLYLAVFDCTSLYHNSTCLYLTVLHLTVALLVSTWLYFTLPWLYLSLLDCTSLYHNSTCLYLTVLHLTMALLDSTWLYFTLPWLYLTLLHFTIALLDSLWFYFNYTMALLDCVSLCRVINSAHMFPQFYVYSPKCGELFLYEAGHAA